MGPQVRSRGPPGNKVPRVARRYTRPSTETNREYCKPRPGTRRRGSTSVLQPKREPDTWRRPAKGTVPGHELGSRSARAAHAGLLCRLFVKYRILGEGS